MSKIRRLHPGPLNRTRFNKAIVDGRKKFSAPIDMIVFPCFSHYLQGFHTCWVMQDFFHQQLLHTWFIQHSGTPQNDQSIGHPTKFIKIQTVQLTLGVFKVNLKKNEVSPPREKSRVFLNQASTPAPKEGLMFVSSVVKS